MKNISKTYWAASQNREGVTLFETVVGLILMATLGVMLLVGMSSHMRLLKQAQIMNQSSSIAEELLVSWYSSANGLPRSESGFWPPDRRWQYRLQPMRPQRIGRADFEVVQLSVWNVTAPHTGICRLELLRARRVGEGR